MAKPRLLDEKTTGVLAAAMRAHAKTLRDDATTFAKHDERLAAGVTADAAVLDEIAEEIEFTRVQLTPVY